MWPYVARKVVLDDRNPDNTVTDLLITSERDIEILRERDWGRERNTSSSLYTTYRYNMILLLLLLLRMLLFGPDPCQIKSAGANQFKGWGVRIKKTNKNNSMRWLPFILFLHIIKYNFFIYNRLLNDKII